MKINFNFLFCCVAVVLLSCGIEPVSATPGSTSNLGLEHLDGVTDFSRWSVGIYGLGRERTSGLNDIKHQKYMGYVGYDVLRWMTTYVTLGESKTKIGIAEYGDWEAEYGLGVTMNLIDHVLPDPFLMEDRIRVNAGVEYTRCTTETLGSDVDWGELYAQLTIGIVNDIDGSKFYLPNSIGIYGGPITTIVHGDSQINNGDEFGYTIGTDLYFSETVSLEFAIEILDTTDFAGGLHIRF